MLTAAEPFLRRPIFVPGEQRFSFASASLPIGPTSHSLRIRPRNHIWVEPQEPTRNDRKRKQRQVRFEERCPQLHQRLTEGTVEQLQALRPNAASKEDNLCVLAVYCLLVGLTVYGGALRDSSARLPIKDLDTAVPCIAAVFVEWAYHYAARLRVEVEPLGYVFAGMNVAEPPQGSPPTHAELHFTYAGMALQVDLTAATVLKEVDLDVNGLWIRPRTTQALKHKLEVRYGVGLSKEEIIAKCEA